MLFTHDQIISKLTTSPYNVFYNPSTPAQSLAEGLEGNSLLQFLKIWCINQDPKTLSEKLAPIPSLSYLQLDRNGMDHAVCECVSSMMRQNRSLIELVLGKTNSDIRSQQD